MSCYFRGISVLSKIISIHGWLGNPLWKILCLKIPDTVLSSTQCILVCLLDHWNQCSCPWDPWGTCDPPILEQTNQTVKGKLWPRGWRNSVNLILTSSLSLGECMTQGAKQNLTYLENQNTVFCTSIGQIFCRLGFPAHQGCFCTWLSLVGQFT